jgi:hypothetical protein
MVSIAVGILVAILVGGTSARADFVICNPKPTDEAINRPGAVHPSGCSFLPDGLKLYFAQGRDSGEVTRRDLWVVERESTDAPWGEAVNLGPNVNSPEDDDGRPAISPDDLELYFVKWSPAQGKELLMRSTRASKDEPWGPAAEFTGLGQAWRLDFAPDGLSVYFNSRRSGGYGGRDIWVSTRATTQDDWGEAVNLGPNVNDSGGQNQPSISNDGLALFFGNWATRRILMCTRTTTDDDWGPAIDLGPAVNGQSSWVAYPEISPDGSTLYFASSEGLFRQVSIKPVVDFDDNGSVGMDDLLTMIGALGTDDQLCDIGPMPWGNGVVDEADLEILMEHWGVIYPIIVDDFESYIVEGDIFDPGQIYMTWIDGWGDPENGSQVGYAEAPFVEPTTVHGGMQSMPFLYDNSTSPVSRTFRAWENPQDWTSADVLKLWVYGQSNNSVEPFFVLLRDNTNNSATVTLPDFDPTTESWQQLSLPLGDFAGVDLATIKRIYFGIGDESKPGGSGKLFIDDIELYSSSSGQ